MSGAKEMARNLLAQEPGRVESHAEAADTQIIAQRKPARHNGGTPYRVTPSAGDPFCIAVSGRMRWALEELRKAGAKGITSVENPAPRLACARGTMFPRTRQRLPSAKPNKRPKLQSGQRKPNGFGTKPSPSAARLPKPICGGGALPAPCPIPCAFIPSAGMGRPPSGIPHWWLRCTAQAMRQCIAPTCALMARAKLTLNRQRRCWGPSLVALCSLSMCRGRWWSRKASKPPCRLPLAYCAPLRRYGLRCPHPAFAACACLPEIHARSDRGRSPEKSHRRPAPLEFPAVKLKARCCSDSAYNSTTKTPSMMGLSCSAKCAH